MGTKTLDEVVAKLTNYLANELVETFLYNHYEEYLDGKFEGDETWTTAYQALEARAAIEEEKWALEHSRYYM